MPVFTAHPTEAKRRTVLLKLADVAEALDRLDSGTLTPREIEIEYEWLRELIVSLWETDETRHAKPTVIDEVRGGLYYFERTLFDLVPEMEARLRRALERTWPGEAFDVPHFLQFGSWVGGDRDGNPYVTPAVTEETLREQQMAALRLYRRAFERMHGHLSVAEERGVRWQRELVLYVVHGVLHLCGFDDHSDEDSHAMRVAERAVMDALDYEVDDAPHHM